MIDYNKLKGVFPSGLPEAHTVFATTAADLTYQKLRDAVGNAPTNRKVWLNFKDVYAEKTKDVPVSSIVITGGAANLYFTKTLQLGATVSPSNATNKIVSWKSSDTTIATVSPTGLVAALSKAGNVTITATAGGKSTTLTIAVKAETVAVTGIAVTPKTATVEVGKTVKLTATVSPANASNKTVTYVSADTAKATVGSDGTVTIKSNAPEGTVVITAKSIDGNKTDTATITIVAASAGV